MTGARRVAIAIATLLVALTGCSKDGVDPGPDDASPSAPAAPTPPAGPPVCDLADDETSCATWQADAASVTADGDLVVTANETTVTALDATSGETLWTAETDGSASGVQVIPAGVLVMSGSAPFDEAEPPDTSTTLLSRSDGTPVWSAPGSANRALDDDGVLGLFPGNGEVTAVSVEDGTPLWSAAVSLFGFQPVNDDIVILSDEGSMTAVDALTGEEVWTLDDVVVSLNGLRTAEGFSRRASLVDDQLLVADRPNRGQPQPVLVDIADGRIVIEFAAGTRAAPVGGAVITIVDSEVIGLDRTGNELWSITGRPLVDSDSTGLLVLAEEDGMEGLAALDPTDGARRWQTRTDIDTIRSFDRAGGLAALTRGASITIHDDHTGEVLTVVRARDPQLVTLEPLIVFDGTTVSAVPLP